MRKKKRLKNNINEVLKEKGITKRELAIQIEMNETQLTQIASGRDCLLSTAQKISKGLHKKLDELWPTI